MNGLYAQRLVEMVTKLELENVLAMAIVKVIIMISDYVIWETVAHGLNGLHGAVVTRKLELGLLNEFA